MATAVFGGLTPYLAQVLIARTGLAIMPGVMKAVVALCILPVLLGMSETLPVRARADALQRD